MSKSPKIPGGYYMKARIIEHKKIAHAAPHIRDIWDYCLRKARHIPKENGYFTIERGQFFKSYQQIKDDLHWMIGWRKMTYTESQMKNAMKFLRDNQMITTQKKLGGVLVTLVNYDFYQNPKNYEKTTDKTTDQTNNKLRLNQCQTSYNIKNDKNDNNLKNENNNTTTTSENSEPEPDFNPSFLFDDVEQDPNLTQAVGLMRGVLCFSDYQLQQVHANVSDYAKLLESVKSTVDANSSSIQRTGKALDNPFSFLMAALKKEFKSLDTRTEAGKKYLNGGGSCILSDDEIKTILTQAFTKHQDNHAALCVDIKTNHKALYQFVKSDPFLHLNAEASIAQIIQQYKRKLNQ